MKYAIIDSQTNLVSNIVESDTESTIFLEENQYTVEATKSTTIGISYDPKTKTFPEVLELDDLLDFYEEVDSLTSEVTTPLPSHLSPENFELFVTYLGSLSTIRTMNPSEGRVELSKISKPDLSLLIPPPEPEESPVGISTSN